MPPLQIPHQPRKLDRSFGGGLFVAHVGRSPERLGELVFGIDEVAVAGGKQSAQRLGLDEQWRKSNRLGHSMHGNGFAIREVGLPGTGLRSGGAQPCTKPRHRIGGLRIARQGIARYVRGRGKARLGSREPREHGSSLILREVRGSGEH